MQPDPLSLGAADASNPQSLNLYSYVGNDPMNFVDPSGLLLVEVCEADRAIPSKSGGEIIAGRCYLVDIPWGGGGGGFGGSGGGFGSGGGGGGGTGGSGGGFGPQNPRQQPTPTPQPCDPGFFASSDEANYRGFSGNDLNTVARVVYAEAAGVAAGGTDEEGDAIVSVIYNRLQRPGYFNRPPNQTLSDVVYGARRNRAGAITGGIQFESVTGHGGGGNNKWRNTAGDGYRSLNQAECNELRRGVAAVNRLLQRGASSHAFTEFRAAGRNPPAGWTVIGGNRFR